MRLINAEPLKEKIDNIWKGRPLSTLGAKILVTIDDAPTIDAVDVVRCKECKHYIVEGITTQYGWCHEYKHSVDEDDYCSSGERKK